MSDQNLAAENVDQPNYDHEPTMSEQEIADYQDVDIYFNADGSLDYRNTVYSIGRALTRVGQAVPKRFKGKPFENAWFGAEQFKPKQIEMYLLKFDIRADRKLIQKTLNNLVREEVFARIETENEEGEKRNIKNLYQANASML